MARAVLTSLAAAAFAMVASGTIVPFDRRKVALYVEGVFDNSYSHDEMLADAAEVAASGFGTAILAFLHVHTDNACPNNLVYNNVCFNDASSLKDVISVLRGPTSSISNIIISIGGAGCTSDFDAIGSSWATFSKAFPALLQEFDIDGFDVDLEDELSPYMGTLVKLVELGVKHNMSITATPVGDPADDYVAWLTNTSTLRPGKLPGVEWLNVQTYYGGAGDQIASWAQAMTGVVPSPSTYAIPGGEVGGGFGPSDMASLVQCVITGAQCAEPPADVDHAGHAHGGGDKRKGKHGKGRHHRHHGHVKGGKAASRHLRHHIENAAAAAAVMPSAGVAINGAFVWDYRMIKYFSNGPVDNNVTAWGSAIVGAFGQE